MRLLSLIGLALASACGTSDRKPETSPQPTVWTNVSSPVSSRYAGTIEDFVRATDWSEGALSAAPAVTYTSYEASRFRAMGVFYANRVRFVQTADFDVWLLRQKINPDAMDYDGWPYFAMITDKREAQPQARFYDLLPSPRGYAPRYEDGCETCHTSGARLLRPYPSAYTDALTEADWQVMDSLNARIRAQGRLGVYAVEPRERDPLPLAQCAACHSDSPSAPKPALHRRHRFAIDATIDAHATEGGYVELGRAEGRAIMPPAGALPDALVACVKAWTAGQGAWDCQGQ